MIDFVGKNRWGEIIVDCRCETDIPGLFAAGDVTNVPQKQIVVAAGEGCKAALSAFSYISKK
jgi:alkyl hydroperoxide reductase subunit F